jgi:long-chain acyl-CoA synthetase
VLAGNSFENALVAVVVPKEGPLRDGVQADASIAFEALCQLPEAKKFILQALAEQGKLSKLRGFEFIKNVHLDHEEFSAANDLMTPTFKLRRPQLKDYYQSMINEMYMALKA